MDDRRFDALSRAIGASVLRRSVAKGVLGALVAGIASATKLPLGEAKKKKKKPCKKKMKPGCPGYCNAKAGFRCKDGYYCDRNKCHFGCRPGTNCGACTPHLAHCDTIEECCSGTTCSDNGCDGRVCCKYQGQFCSYHCDCCGNLGCYNGQCQPF